MEPCCWIEHHGIRILRVNYSGCHTDEDLLRVLALQVDAIREAQVKVRVLHDYQDAFLGERFLQAVENYSKNYKTSFIEKAAAIGLTGVRKALWSAYRIKSGDHNSQSFLTEEKALDWLALP